MTDEYLTLLWVQVGGHIWLALVLQWVYLRIYREPFLRFWSFSYGVLGLALGLQLALRAPLSTEVITSPVPYLFGMGQFALIILAALSLKPPAPSGRRQVLVLAGIMAGLFVLYLATARMVADPVELARTVRFERQVLGAASGAWFSIAFWRWHPLARTAGGRVTVFFTALYAVRSVLQGLAILGLLPWLGPYPVALASLAVILPIGVLTGMMILASQALVATTKNLRDSEERYRTLMDASPNGIVATDPAGVILMCNRHAAEVHGYADAAELVGMQARMLLAPADRDRFRATVTERRPIGLECQILRRDGSERSAEFVTAPFRASDDTIAGAVTCVRDITERKLELQELRLSRQRLALHVQQTPLAVIEFDPDGRVRAWNPGAVATFGFSPEEAIGQHWKFLAPESAWETKDGLWKELLARRGGRRSAGENITKDGRTIFCEWFNTVLVDSAGGTIGVATLVMNVTDRKRAEEEKARLQEQLSQAQKMESIGRLAGGVAHDFNNLLTVINGYAAFLWQQLAAQDPLREHAEEIVKAGERAAALTSQLLAFSRKQVIKPRAIGLNDVVADAERMLQRVIGEDVKLATSLAPGVGLVMADPDQIHQVILNLAVNARDAMPEGGKLEIATADVELDAAAVAMHTDAVPGRYVRLSVADNGTGMTEDLRRRIFEPFFTTKEQGKGTGLGLATVYGILRQNGGWIDVQSEMGQGSTFRIYLPCVDAGPSTEQATPAATDTPHGGETVLVVEDQDAVRRLAKMALTTHGYHVLEAANGAEAHSVAGRYAGEIHLLLTDVVMPGIGGRALAEQMRELRPNLAVILMSGYSEDVVANQDALAGGVMYIQKPFDPNELAAKVRDVLAFPCPRPATDPPK